MATLKRKNESGNWDYLQLTGKDISDLQQEFVSHLADDVKHLTTGDRTKIDGALQRTGGTMTGPLELNNSRTRLSGLDPQNNHFINFSSGESDNILSIHRRGIRDCDLNIYHKGDRSEIIHAGNIERFGSVTQTGEYTDTTTTVQPRTTYTKRIALQGNPIRGRLRAVRGSRSYFHAEFTTNKSDTIGFYLPSGTGSSGVGIDGVAGGIFSSQTGSTWANGTSLEVESIWIDSAKKELVITFWNGSVSNVATMNIGKTNGNTGIVWEVSS